MRYLLVFLILLCTVNMLARPANAEQLIADISRHEIEIDSSFRGMDILLFGAATPTGDIFVAVRGEDKSYVIRKKERIGGVWINTKSHQFNSIPAFYVNASSRSTTSLNITERSSILTTLNLGLDNIIKIENSNLQQIDFKDAFVNKKTEKKLYQDEMQKISFMGETLFRTVLKFPENTPRGVYSIDIYLVEGGVLKSFQTIPLVVRKKGFDAFVFDFSRGYPFIYGLFAILIAVFAGWFAGEMVRKV